MNNSVKSFYAMRNQVRDYAWGHPHHIPRLLNLDWPEGKPAAEVWMGAHPAAPSMVEVGGQWVGLDKWIAENPVALLGRESMQEYGRLPYLLKLLAAGKSLSIQAHPDKVRAEEGFARENENAVPIDSPRRNYRDDNHKPEVLMALSPFTAMIGFRPFREIYTNFRPLFNEPDFFSFESGGGPSLRDFLRNLLTLPMARRDALLSKALEYAEGSGESSCGWDSLQREWIFRLARQFPSDIGALAPLFLHVLRIQPGEALYQPAGMLHAYLDGFGVELMANSDNVLRGGLTPKNIDVPELLRVLDFESTKPCVLKLPTEDARNSLGFFPTLAKEFALGLGSLTGESGTKLQIPGGEGPVVILNLDGRLILDDGNDTLSLARGQSAFVPHASPRVNITGVGQAAVAGLGR